MKRYIIKRLLQLIPTLIGVSIITFFLIRLAPGDPATAILGINATPEKVEYINKVYRLDQPLPIQYLSWMGKVFKLDLGRSILFNQDITELLLVRIPVSFQLALFAMLISLLVSLPSGIISAVKRNTLFDHMARFVAFLGISIPGFWLGILLLYLFGVLVPLFPLYGFKSIFTDFSAGINHIFLPALTLGLALAAMVTRMTRSSMLDILHENYITTARSKGLIERAVILKHAFNNAIIPIITVVGVQLGYILGGSVLVEVVFALPGLGRLMVDSIFKRDYPVVQAIVLFYALIFILINLIVDLLYAYLDPRISYE